MVKIKITEKGVYGRNKKGVEERIAVGRTFDVDGGKIPPNLVGKCVVVDGAGAKTALTNPQLSPEQLGRRERLIALSEKLEKAQFTKAGLPDVGAINQLLDSGETAFTAEERNALWVSVEA